MKKNNKGFTLIEMLVVIAVVGILSATVLTALGPARNKGRDARIQSGINQIAAILETRFNGNSYDADLTNDIYKSAIADIKSFNGSVDLTYNRNGAGDFYAVSSPLASGGFYCRDSSGRTGGKVAATGVCP